MNCKPTEFKPLESLPKELLSIEEEYALARLIQKKKSTADIEKLVLHNMHEAFLYAKKVCRAQIKDGDIFSLCYKALDRMAKRYKPDGLRFFVYCKVAIRGEISNYWENEETVRHGNTLSLEQASNEKNQFLPICLGSGGTEEGSKYIDWCAIIVTGANYRELEPHTQSCVRALERKEDVAFVRAIMKKSLSPQEAMVMELVYRAGFNFQDIARMLKITRSMVQKIHSQAIKNIRFAIAKNERLLNREKLT